MLIAVVSLLLLIACSNVASLLLAHGAARQQEMAVRAALGASPLRLVRQALSEALLLSAAGSLLGIVLAYFAVDTLVGVLVSGRAPIGFPQGLEIQVQPDVRVLLFTAGVTLLTGLLFGMAPGWNALASGATMAMIAVALLASYIPARRASRVQPLEALRHT